MAIPNSTLTRIEREAIYDDGSARLLLGVTERVTARARRDGVLRYTRLGHRVLYLGSWLLEWLEAASEEGQKNANEVQEGHGAAS